MATKTKKFTKYETVYVYDYGTELEENRGNATNLATPLTEEVIRQKYSYFSRQESHCRERIFYSGEDTLVIKNEDFEPQNCRFSGKSWNFTLSHEEYEKLKAEGYNWE